jgi:hypothetical protein
MKKPYICSVFGVQLPNDHFIIKNIDMFKKILPAVAVVLSLVACGHEPGVAQPSVSGGKHFGEKITTAGAVDYAELPLKMDGVDSLAIKLVGTVKEVCQVKGCWMTFTATGMPDMRVTFKDYAFFMPLDLAGKRVVVDGYAYVNLTPVDELRHYAEDAGKTPEEVAAITEPLLEIAYEAKGVVILD